MYNGACKSHIPNAVDEIIVIDVDRALRSTGMLSMSDFIDSISFIPIYDGNSAYIGDPLRMEMTDSHILVYDMTRRLVLYNCR